MLWENMNGGHFSNFSGTSVSNPLWYVQLFECECWFYCFL